MSDFEHEHEHGHEPWIDDVARELQRPPRLSPGFDRRVMAEVRAAAAAVPESTASREWRWSVTLTPFRTMAAAAALVALVAAGGWLVARELQRPTPAPFANTAVAGERGRALRDIQFVVVAPNAAEVTLVGDFNDWSSTATPMHLASTSGVWSVTVPLPAGRYQYAFVINGREWRADPAAPAAAVDDFGAPSSIVAVADHAS